MREKKHSFIETNKIVYIWGCGTCANVAVQYCINHEICISGFIDSDLRKIGLPVGYLLSETLDTQFERCEISSPDILNTISSDDVTIIISASRAYGEIATALERIGYSSYYSTEELVGDWRILPSEDEKKFFAQQCIKHLEINPNAVLFSAYSNYTDHERYISQALQATGNNVEIWWLVDLFESVLPDGVKKIWRGNWKAVIKAYETAKVWVQDLAIDMYIQKRPGQVYIQTKHWGSLTFKRFYLDTHAFNGIASKYDLWARDGKLIDYIITGSEFDRESCRRGMGYDGEFLDYGSPRTDALFHIEELREKVCDHYKIPYDKKILVYAPTYRFDKKLGNEYHASRDLQLDYDKVKAALKLRFGGEWIIMLRLHPSVTQASLGFESREYVINASFYEDSEELVAASDILVTDFSSIGMEPAFVKKITMLLATDLDDYLKNEYDLLLDYRSLPFPIAETNDQLAENIINFDQEKYERDITEFLDKYGVHEDGHASERTADFIVKRMKTEGSEDISGSAEIDANA